MTDLAHVVSGLRHMDDDERALAALPLLADRMAYHTKRLRLIRFLDGITGEKAYKSKHEEARTIQTTATSNAFQQKPSGYDAFLCKLVEAWFVSDTALAESNRAAVERLNVAMAPRRFNPDNHFTKPLSPGRLEKLAAVFAAHGAHLDMTVNSMSKVRAAVKAAKASAQPDARRIGKFGTISGQMLTIGHRNFCIEQHKGRECIRVTADRITQRVYLPIVQLLLECLGSDPLSYPSDEVIGELVPEPKTPPEGAEPPTVGTSSPAPLSLSDRMAERRAAHLAASLASPI